ncbi:hypothetical protein [Cellulomonas sp. NS3]|uniref:hypothetical protein n=1 Tax=Cellulomonas sp. NS3 TaxID=2973977 RepID=UPI002162EDE9|nr:hypothetical protein [Cellulomonas sp. NS3]
MSDLDGSPLTGDPRSADVLALVAAIRPVRPLAARLPPAPSSGAPAGSSSPPGPAGPVALSTLVARPGAARVDVGAPAPASAGRARPAR